MTEDKSVEWHHQFDGHEFEQVSRVGDEQMAVVLQSMELQRVGFDSETELN